MEKIYSNDNSNYSQKSVSGRIEAFFLNNIGKVVTGAQIARVATDPVDGLPRENWHQRVSELRTDKGYTILTNRDAPGLLPSEYLMMDTVRRDIAARRVLPSKACWKSVLENAGNRCQWVEDGHVCRLASGHQDPIGGGTVRLTPDHMTPHSLDPAADPNDPTKWQALCGRHQVMKKNFWDSSTGKFNLQGILQSVGRQEKLTAYNLLKSYFGDDDKT
ncbi:restriction endonuclease [Pseudomonas sp. 25 E 4]|uniref:restriction endonuclease n=1 Tax=Pseudomonas sp. 25 E 4 TaxID=1844097 RepID=UPI0008129326|nr:restriction endonuclease [Pseudomonas sp. 25 E 4]CRM04019.1 Type-2 restriction enzyme KpnI [Pseudomonas sp. 25 E 4]